MTRVPGTPRAASALPAVIALFALAAAALPAPARAQAIYPPDVVEMTVATGLGSPTTGFAFLPDGRFLVCDKPGRVKVVNIAGQFATILTLANVYTTGEAGLAGIAVDPAWPARPYVYLHYNQNSPHRLVIARYTASEDLDDPMSTTLPLSDPYVILEVDDSGPNHNGSCLRFGPSGLLYVSLGDDVLSCVAQDSTELKGVIARITVDNLPPGAGGPPPRSQILPSGNPFAPDTTGAELVWCYGLRNPYRFTVDPYTENLYIGDVGGTEFEEVDISGGGENFGWPILEAHDSTGVWCFQGLPRFSEPMLNYWHDPSDPTGGEGFYAIVGGPLYRGGARPIRFPLEYEGAYFYSDVQKGWIRVAHEVAGQWEPMFVPGQADSVNWAKGLGFVTDFQQGEDGALYYLTYFGILRKISYLGPVSAVPPAAPSPAALRASPNPFRAGTPTRFEGMDGESSLTVFDAQGRLVRRLDRPEWDGRDAAGQAVRAGRYFIAAASGRHVGVLVAE
jgi:glucose/arabinose dehydrogenase